jgi:hypothetical protein
MMKPLPRCRPHIASEKKSGNEKPRTQRAKEGVMIFAPPEYLLGKKKSIFVMMVVVM